jgi:hypothetical protein
VDARDKRGHDNVASSAAFRSGATRRRAATVEVTAEVVAGSISTSANDLQLVQRQFSYRFDLFSVRHFHFPLSVRHESPNRSRLTGRVAAATAVRSATSATHGRWPTAVSAAGNGFHFVQRQLSNGLDEFCLIEVRHFQTPSGWIADVDTYKHEIEFCGLPTGPSFGPASPASSFMAMVI